MSFSSFQLLFLSFFLLFSLSCFPVVLFSLSTAAALMPQVLVSSIKVMDSFNETCVKHSAHVLPKVKDEIFILHLILENRPMKRSVSELKPRLVEASDIMTNCHKLKVCINSLYSWLLTFP